MALGNDKEVKMEVENPSTNQTEEENRVDPFTLEILPLIKENQSTHGLRHGDYQRYRQYCTRRLRRLYKTLHFQQGSRNNIKPKKVTENVVKDVKFLHIPLIDAERAWSHAMELKLLANTEPRKRFHLIRRLRNAAGHADSLEKLCQGSLCDARTKLEAQAYASYMKGSVSFELQKWKEALELFGRARTIYEKLAGAFSEEHRNMYLQRVEEITPNIRYCAYNLGEGGTDINDLMQMRMSSTGGVQDPVLAAKIDEVLAQTREKEAESMTEVTWRGRSIPVKNEKVRAFILHAQQIARELDSAEDADSKMSMYEELLMESKDALQAVKDELKGDTSSGKPRSQKSETQVAQLQSLQSYITYVKLSKTTDRNLLMVEAMKKQLPASLQDSSEAVEPDPTKKLTKPEDLVRIYDIILQTLSDMGELPGVDDDIEMSKDISAQILHFKAYRCFYIAKSYLQAKKWREAAMLYDRVTSHAESAMEHFQESQDYQSKVR
ncbi:Signal recognition particle subunit SRP68 [Exaiptasia diaphana]|nr:Signal recognition particle subunit SRP68 [Exaiptasia diaphana]